MTGKESLQESECLWMKYRRKQKSRKSSRMSKSWYRKWLSRQTNFIYESVQRLITNLAWLNNLNHNESSRQSNEHHLHVCSIQRSLLFRPGIRGTVRAVQRWGLDEVCEGKRHEKYHLDGLNWCHLFETISKLYHWNGNEFK